jgi:predicted GIY-YIG superfamily endonuclease
MSNTNIYILKLKDGKYYIGKSDNPMARYQDHLNGIGSTWTNKYKPVAIEKIIQNASNFDEDKYTKEYMAKYGIDNVRGGTYVSTNLSMTQKESLQAEIWTAQNKCTNCGKIGHFINDCYYKRNKSNTNNYIQPLNNKAYKSSDACYRCGREGHYADE